MNYEKRYVIRNSCSGAYVHKTLFRIRAFRSKNDAIMYMRTHRLNKRFYEVRDIERWTG